MLRAAIAAFLDTVTEREFDPVILALLSAQGFRDVHFIHGSFEFGKDIIAKRADPDTGVLHQYAIQSKAGNIGLPEWRAVRPQIDEAGYNPLGHPNFDSSLPRVAVLLTTGRLKGAAGTDSQQYALSAETRGLARVEFWDQEDMTAWLISDPDLGLLSLGEQRELQQVLAEVHSDFIDEPRLERFTRRWMDEGRDGAAAIEGAVLVNALRDGRRLDLAAMCAIHLFRGACVRGIDHELTPHAVSAKRLVIAVAMLLLDAVETLLEDPADLARVDAHPASLVSYAVTCVRTAEILALAALTTTDTRERDRLASAVVALATRHPGTARPVSDQFAISLLPITLTVRREDRQLARSYLRSCATWMMDRHDPELDGLGLGSMEDAPISVVQRLLGGLLDATDLTISRSSYVLTVVLDLALELEELELYSDILADANALQLTPLTTTVGTRPENFRRAGGAVIPLPWLEYGTSGRVRPDLPRESPWTADDALLLMASCRSRHYLEGVTAIA